MLVSSNPVMREARAQCSRVAPTDASVLILGETGVGKELLARALHEESGRAGRFVALNCGAVPETLIEAELFGHEAGAFTGATGSKEGLFRAASQGTLFLDEVGDLPQAAQVSTLRALQERRIRPVGSSDEVEVNVRIVAATRWDLDAEVEAQRFRADLLYRLDVIRVVIPPLRERPEDVLPLFQRFSRQFAERHRVPVREWTPAFERELLSYAWPGNVRELMNLAERASLSERLGPLDLGDLERLLIGSGRFHRSAVETLSAPPPPPAAPAAPAPSGPRCTLADELERTERRYLEGVLSEHRGRIAASAQAAGISRRTLLRKLKRHGIDKHAFMGA